MDVEGDHNPTRSEGSKEPLYFHEIFAQSPSVAALLEGPEHRFALVNPAFQQLIGNRQVIGLTLREALPEAEGQGILALLGEVLATGKAFIGRDIEITLQLVPGRAAETRFLDFVYQPIRDEFGRVTSIFVEGSDTTERRAHEDALRPPRRGFAS